MAEHFGDCQWENPQRSIKPVPNMISCDNWTNWVDFFFNLTIFNDWVQTISKKLQKLQRSVDYIFSNLSFLQKQLNDDRRTDMWYAVGGTLSQRVTKLGLGFSRVRKTQPKNGVRDKANGNSSNAWLMQFSLWNLYVRLLPSFGSVPTTVGNGKKI